MWLCDSRLQSYGVFNFCAVFLSHPAVITVSVTAITRSTNTTAVTSTLSTDTVHLGYFFSFSVSAYVVGFHVTLHTLRHFGDDFIPPIKSSPK